MYLVLPCMGGKTDVRRCGFNVSQGEPGWIQENISDVFPAQGWLVKVLFGLPSSVRWRVQQRMDMAPSCHSGAMNYLWWKELSMLYVQHRQKQVGFSSLGSPFAAAQTSPNLLAKVGSYTLEEEQFPISPANSGNASFILLSFTMSWLD